jgi:hypothetical protein
MAVRPVVPELGCHAVHFATCEVGPPPGGLLVLAEHSGAIVRRYVGCKNLLPITLTHWANMLICDTFFAEELNDESLIVFHPSSQKTKTHEPASRNPKCSSDMMRLQHLFTGPTQDSEVS